jgi:hypothetical protein
MYNNIMADAQAAEAFLISQLTYIEREVYVIRYPSIRYPEIVPVDSSANPWIPSITYFSMDGVGQAQWFNARALDIPKSEVVRTKFETTVKMAAIGYGYDMEELAQAQMLGHNLNADKARYARFAAEQFIDQAALFGDVGANFTGLLNSPQVTTGPAAAVGNLNGFTNSLLWVNKTPDQILADVNGMIAGIWITTNTVELADTLLLPLLDWQYISTTRLNDLSQVTILQWLRINNAYTAETGAELMIRPIRGLDTAGAGGTARMVAYWRDPSVVKMHIPMPYRFIGVPWQTRPLYFEIPGIFRIGGVDIRRPAAFRYMDGI